MVVYRKRPYAIADSRRCSKPVRFSKKRCQAKQKAKQHPCLRPQQAGVRTPNDFADIVNKQGTSKRIGLESNDRVRKIRHAFFDQHVSYNRGPMAEIIITSIARTPQQAQKVNGPR